MRNCVEREDMYSFAWPLILSPPFSQSPMTPAMEPAMAPAMAPARAPAKALPMASQMAPLPPLPYYAISTASDMAITTAFGSWTTRSWSLSRLKSGDLLQIVGEWGKNGQKPSKNHSLLNETETQSFLNLDPSFITRSNPDNVTQSCLSLCVFRSIRKLFLRSVWYWTWPSRPVKRSRVSRKHHPDVNMSMSWA